MLPMTRLALALVMSSLLASPAWSETCDSKPFTLGKPAAKPAPKPAEPPKVVQAKPVKPAKKPNPVGVAPCKTDQNKKAA
jgi:hypothetical protein